MRNDLATTLGLALLLALSPVRVRAADAAPATETPAASTDDGARCRENFTMDGLMRHIDQAGMTADGLDMALIENHSLCYYQCRAYALKDLSQCDPMKSFKINVGMRGGHLPGNLACADHNLDLAFVRALITRDPKFMDACRDNLIKGAVQLEGVTPENAGSYCEKVLKYVDDPAALCKALGPDSFNVKLKPENAKKCELNFRGIHGDVKACDKLPAESHIKERCYGYAAFYKAWNGHDEKLCGGNPICKIFFGAGPEACQPYATLIRGAVCRQLPNYSDPKTDAAPAAR